MGLKCKRLIAILPGALLLVLIASSGTARGDNGDLATYLVGKWHQEVGNLVADAVFNADGTFTSLAQTRETSYHEGAQGHWEIRNGNELWQHNEQCSPDDCAAEWDSTWVKVIDQNHFQNKFGDVYRQ